MAYGAPQGGIRALRGSAVPLAYGAPQGGIRALRGSLCGASGTRYVTMRGLIGIHRVQVTHAP
eukprot:950049-Prymnesium_polylepis.1